MDVVLEQVCRDLRHGGDQESRKHIAQCLMQSAKKGNITLEELRAVASRALTQPKIGMKLTHRFAELTPEKRPQDPNIDGTGLLREDGARRRISAI